MLVINKYISALLLLTSLYSYTMELAYDQQQTYFLQLPSEIFLSITAQSSLQSLSRLKRVCQDWNTLIDFSPDNKNFNTDKLSSLLVQDYDRCTYALISCAHVKKIELFDALISKQNTTDYIKRKEDVLYLGWENQNLQAYRGESQQSQQSCFNLAVRNNRLSLVQILLSSGTVTITNELNYGYQYPSNGNDQDVSNVIKILTLLIPKGINLDTQLYSRSAHSLLTEATLSAHTQLITFLLQNSVDPNTTCEAGFTVLHQVAFQNKFQTKKHAPCIKNLILAGADINKPNCHNETPIEIARNNGKYKLVNLMLKCAEEYSKNNKDNP